MRLTSRFLALFLALSVVVLVGCFGDDDDEIWPLSGAIKLSAVADAGDATFPAAMRVSTPASIRAAVAAKFQARIKIGVGGYRTFSLDRSDDGKKLTLDATVSGVETGKQQVTIEIVASGVADAEPILKTIKTAEVTAGQTNDSDINNVPVNYETTAKALAYESWSENTSKNIDQFAPDQSSVDSLEAKIKTAVEAELANPVPTKFTFSDEIKTGAGQVATGGGSSAPTLDYTSTNVGTMRYVPAGTFQRDATAGNLSTVAAFRIGLYEITQRQYADITGLGNPSRYSSINNGPVESVSWYNALVFCNKLSMLEGLTPVYSIEGSTDPAVWVSNAGGSVPTSNNSAWNAVSCNWGANGYRLPTEMEWLWAAMGADNGNAGATNTIGYTKGFAGSNGSNSAGDYGWFWTNSPDGTKTVGTKTANELGLYDMTGNVYEWCWDWFGDQPSGQLTNYRGPDSGTARVERGAGWNTWAEHLPLSTRMFSAAPTARYDTLGFRVVRN